MGEVVGHHAAPVQEDGPLAEGTHLPPGSRSLMSLLMTSSSELMERTVAMATRFF